MTSPPRGSAKPSLLQQSIDDSAKQLYKELQLQASDLYGQHIGENRQHVLASRQGVSRSRMQDTSKVERTLLERLAQSDKGLDQIERLASDRLRRALEEKLGRLAATQYYVRANRVYHAAQVNLQRKAIEDEGRMTLRKLLERTTPPLVVASGDEQQLRPGTAAAACSSSSSLGAPKGGTASVLHGLADERRRAAEALAATTQQTAAFNNPHHPPPPPLPHRSAASKPPTAYAKPTKLGDLGDLDWGPSPIQGGSNQQQEQHHGNDGHLRGHQPSPFRPPSSSSSATKQTAGGMPSRLASSNGTRSRMTLPPMPLLVDDKPAGAGGASGKKGRPDAFPETADRAASALAMHPQRKTPSPGGPPRPRSQQSIVFTALRTILQKNIERSTSPPLRREAISAMARGATGGYAGPPANQPQGRQLTERLASSKGRRSLEGAKRLAAAWIDAYGSHRPTEANMQALHMQMGTASTGQQQQQQQQQQEVKAQGPGRSAVAAAHHAAISQALLAREGLTRPAAPAEGRRRGPDGEPHGEQPAAPVSLEDFFLGEFESPARLQRQQEKEHAPHGAAQRSHPQQQQQSRGDRQPPHREEEKEEDDDEDDEDDPFPMPRADDPDFASSTTSSDGEGDEACRNDDQDDDDGDMSSISTPRLPTIDSPLRPATDAKDAEDQQQQQQEEVDEYADDTADDPPGDVAFTADEPAAIELAEGRHAAVVSPPLRVGSDEQSQQRHVLAHNLVLLLMDDHAAP